MTSKREIFISSHSIYHYICIYYNIDFMIIPPSIQQGDTIGIVAPAGKIDINIVEQACTRIQNMGYKTKLAAHINKPFYNFSATDVERKSDLQEMLNDDSIKCILCTRGGYGSVRIIDKIDFTKFIQNPKWLIGFSDITVIHSALNKNNIASIHGPMVKSFLNYTETGADIDILFSILEGEKPVYMINTHPFNKHGEAEGEVIGGNLSILHSLTNTPFDLNTKGKILFIEDLSEYLYHLDRTMHNLKLSGFLKDLSGLVIGQFTDMLDNENPFGESIEQIIYNAVAEYNYPVAFNFPSGHVETNYPLILGEKAKLDVNINEASLVYG